MSLTIPGDGASQAVYLRQTGGVIEYSVGATSGGSYTAISSGQWPVTINNTPSPGPSSILRVIATTNLTLTSSYGNTNGYLIAGSTYITFDGSGNTITMDGITGYPGFITNNTKGFIVVRNFTTTTGGVSTLQATAGWLCQSGFGSGVSGISVTNCTNNGDVNNTSCGGIAGSSAGSSSGSVTFTNCTNNGTISESNAGGMTGYQAGAFSGSATFTNCTNNGTISGNEAGGIAGNSAGQGGSVTFTNCTNTGNITGGNGAGGIAGTNVGYNSGSATFTGCANSGNISSGGRGGIAGNNAGYLNGSVNFTRCSNSGNISVDAGGGITGSGAGQNAGSCTITNCSNSGTISGTEAGGIVGQNAGFTDGLCNITSCFNTGAISGRTAGGITGNQIACNTNQPCTITQCYSTGDITGTNAGGITGGNAGRSANIAYSPVVNITNCYSLGIIATSTGGICGGLFDGGLVYSNPATINITNSYSFGAITAGGQGLVAASLTAPNITLNTSATYIANNAWSDATAIANLTGTPTNINTNNPGATWTTLAADTPYVLSVYNAALYSPSSASSFINYTSAQGLFQSGYTYQLVYTSQAGTAATARVFSSKGTAPYYYSYNFNTFALTNLNGGSGSPISATINASNGVLDFILPYPCFLEGTKILCFENNQEVYRPVESLQKGDLVKTIYNGYMPIYMMGTTSLYNPGNDYRVANRIYKCSREKYPALFEDLYITGCHSILVPSMTDDQWENTKAVNGNIFVTDNHFRLIACADEKAEPFNKEGYMNIYHIALDHHDICMNYGIYANGLLVESCSIEYLIKYSSLKILGQEDCSLSENVSNNIIRQLVDTY